MKDSVEPQPHEDCLAAEPAWLTPIDHTADAGVVVRAPELSTLFERSAWAMFSVITDPERVSARETTPVELEADDSPGLLVAWLSELNYLHVTRHHLFAQFEVNELTERRIAATARGEGVDPHRHTIYTEIKAVTYHELALERSGSGWQARIIFDL